MSECVNVCVDVANELGHGVWLIVWLVHIVRVLVLYQQRECERDGYVYIEPISVGLCQLNDLCKSDARGIAFKHVQCVVDCELDGDSVWLFELVRLSDCVRERDGVCLCL